MADDYSSGWTVGLFSAQVPRELIYAFGCTPVRVFPSTVKPTAAESFLPRNFCSLKRLILASLVEDETDSLDAVIFADEDDATRRLCDVWRASVPVPVWGFVEVPRAANSLAKSRYSQTLARTAADLEARTGRPLSADNLHRAIDLYNEQRSLLGDLKRHWLAENVTTTAYRRLRRLALTRDPAQANESLRQGLAGIQGDGTGSTKSPASRRLLLLAELAAPGGLVRLIEAHGAQVVAEDSDLDERHLAETVQTATNTVEGALTALASAYLSKPPSPRMRDLRRRMTYLTALVSERGVHAAICAYNKFCDLYLTEFPSLKSHLEKQGIPVLLLELEDEAISGQHRTRVEAFLEMIAQRKTVGIAGGVDAESSWC